VRVTRYPQPVIITVQQVRQDGSAVVATVLDGASASEQRFSGDAAAMIALEWERGQFDLSRYAALPPEWPTPAGIPIELPDVS
jgi:hypothetical protein